MPYAFVLLLMSALSAAAVGGDSADRHFTDFVAPLLRSRCVSCHGPDKVKGGLRLDSRESILKAGDSGIPAIVPGKPDESLLLQAVTHSKKELEMPPKEKLTTNDIAVITRWIRDGAPWPESKGLAFLPPKADSTERLGNAWDDPRNPIRRLFGGQRLELWSLKPVVDSHPPAVRNQRWVRTPVDRFILAIFEGRGISPQVEADRRSLGRRIYFDLTGLPPTPDQMTAFLADRRTDAYERLVEDLLQSPAYGEHWARLWLDVVRYSDSNGFDWDEFRPAAWQFRDYVIRSIQADKPFDRFIREQLAGDELFEGPPQTTEQQDALIATGFLRLGPQDNSAPLFNEQDRARAELLADLTETTGSGFLGLTLSCCRCHDHKYDPISQADHFRIRAFFEGVKYADETPLDLAKDQMAIRTHNNLVEEELTLLRQRRDGILSTVKANLREERLAKLDETDRKLLSVPPAQRTNDLKAKIEAIEKKISPSAGEVATALKGLHSDKELHDELEKQIAALNHQKRAFRLGLLMTDTTEKVPPTHILFQGDHKTPKDLVEPGFLSVLDPNPAAIQRGPNKTTSSRRLTLAEWIASASNPLTARVFVNRVWQAYFGQGLVVTANDFGLAGARPSHPQLLDWLATQFIRDGWSLRQLHRQIALSATYRQANRTRTSPSESGPTRTLETSAPMTIVPLRNTRRLTAEQLRDALLAVSGLLAPRSGGPPIWPELPAEILRANPAFLDDNPAKTKGWYQTTGPEQFARSIYLVQKKTVRVPFMETFDLPENSVSCARRTVSTVPPQALALLNSPLAAKASKAFAERVQKEAGQGIDEQINRAFQLALQRTPAPAERETCRQFLEHRGLPSLCRSLLNLNEFVYID